MAKLRFFKVTVVILLLYLAGGSEVRADSAWKEAALGVASVLGSAIYSPVKIPYAALGAFTGGVVWIVTGGKTEVAQKIWEPALRGDYVITPQMLQGDKKPGKAIRDFKKGVSSEDSDEDPKEEESDKKDNSGELPK